jgi:sulfur relay (sulfurtransferase) DsrC/TusE family protein
MSEELREGLAQAFEAASIHTSLEAADLAIAYIRQHDDWQPIETAPKMRKIIVTYKNELGKDRCVMACYYEANALEMNDD